MHDGYKRGVSKRPWQNNKAGEVAEDEISEEVNPFMVRQRKMPVPPEMKTELAMMAGFSTEANFRHWSAPSTIARVDSKVQECLLRSLLAQSEALVRELSLLYRRDKKEAD